MGKITQNQNFWRRLIVRLRSLQAAVLTLAISTGLLVVLTNFQVNAGVREQGRNSQFIQKTHPLPPTLAQWQDKTNSGDYFDQIKSTKVGYLIWSRFPVKVKIETPTDINEKQSTLRNRYKIKRVYNSITQDYNFDNENRVKCVVEYQCVKSNPIYWKFWQTYKFKSFFNKLFKNK